jgi:hypothetical protein
VALNTHTHTHTLWAFVDCSRKNFTFLLSDRSKVWYLSGCNDLGFLLLQLLNVGSVISHCITPFNI